MLIVTTGTVPDREIFKVIGMVQGSVVRAKHLGRDIGAAFKSIVGGEIKDYTTMLTEAREIAVQRMVEEAEKLGANAIINVRFTTSSIMGGASEILTYGTAVKLK